MSRPLLVLSKVMNKPYMRNYGATAAQFVAKPVARFRPAGRRRVLVADNLCQGEVQVGRAASPLLRDRTDKMQQCSRHERVFEG
jgi:hypothetical protein